MEEVPSEEEGTLRPFCFLNSMDLKVMWQVHKYLIMARLRYFRGCCGLKRLFGIRYDKIDLLNLFDLDSHHLCRPECFLFVRRLFLVPKGPFWCYRRYCFGATNPPPSEQNSGYVPDIEVLVTVHK